MFQIIAAFMWFYCSVVGESEASVPFPIEITADGDVYTSPSGHWTMSIMDNELLLANPFTLQGAIWDRSTLKFKRSWNVSSDFYSFAANSRCQKNKFSYASTTSQMILKFDSDGDIVAKWSTGNIRGRPSVMNDCNVAIVPHDTTTRIFIYNLFGDLINYNYIQLKMDIGGARLNCAVQLSNGNFVVSYGTDSDEQHGISFVDLKGNVLRSFGGVKGKGRNGGNGVYDLFEEGIGNVIAVDHNNHRIIRLNSNLEYVNEILSSDSGVLYPHGSIFDDLYRRLFEMGSSWDNKESALSPGKIIVYDITISRNEL